MSGARHHQHNSNRRPHQRRNEDDGETDVNADAKNDETFGASASVAANGGFDLGTISGETAKYEQFLLENNLHRGTGGGGGSSDGGADWAGAHEDLKSLHKQFMAEYTSRPLAPEEGAGAVAATAAGAGASGGVTDEDADFSLKSVLRAIEDEDSAAPMPHAARAARSSAQVNANANVNVNAAAAAAFGGAVAGTPQKAGGVTIPSTPPNPWAFTKADAASPFVSSFMSFSPGDKATFGKPTTAPPAASPLNNITGSNANANAAKPPVRGPAPLQSMPPGYQSLPPGFNGSGQMTGPALVPAQPQPQPPQPLPSRIVQTGPGGPVPKPMVGGVMNIADLEASLRTQRSPNAVPAGAPAQPPPAAGQNGALPPVLAAFLSSGKGSLEPPAQPPQPQTSGQALLQVLHNAAAANAHAPQRPSHVDVPGGPALPFQPLQQRPPYSHQMPPQHYEDHGPYTPQRHHQQPPPQSPQHQPIMASPSTPQPPGTQAAEGNWYIPLPQRFSHSQMSKQEIAYVIRMQLKQLLPRPTLFLPSSSSNATSTNGESAGAAAADGAPPQSPSLSPMKGPGPAAGSEGGASGGSGERQSVPAVLAPATLPDDLAQDDFYCQVFTARKTGGGLKLSGNSSAPPVLSPYRNADGSPKLPEGTLGRIAASSLRKPKKLMSLTGNNAVPIPSTLNPLPEGAKEKEGDGKGGDEQPIAGGNENVPPRQFMFARMSLTYLIEEGIRCLMNVEDVDSVLAAFTQQRFEAPSRAYERQRLIIQRSQLIMRLAEALDISDPTVPMDADHLLLKFAAVPKGRLLIFRSLLLIPPPANHQIITTLMHNLANLAVPDAKSSIDSKLATVLSDTLFNMPLPQLNQVFHIFVSARNGNNIVNLLRSKVGCLICQVLMKRGHTLSLQLQQMQAAIAQQSALIIQQARAAAAAAIAKGQLPPPIPKPNEAINPLLAAQFTQAQAAHAQWRQLFEYFATNVFAGKIAALFAPPLKREIVGSSSAASKSSDDKSAPAAAAPAPAASTASKDNKSAPASAGGGPALAAASDAWEYTSIGALWELIAAILSHARKETRAAFVDEFRGLLKSEIEYITFKIAEARGAAAANVQVAQTPPLPPALAFLASVIAPPAQPAPVPAIAAPTSAPAQPLNVNSSSAPATAPAPTAAATARS